MSATHIIKRMPDIAVVAVLIVALSAGVAYAHDDRQEKELYMELLEWDKLLNDLTEFIAEQKDNYERAKSSQPPGSKNHCPDFHEVYETMSGARSGYLELMRMSCEESHGAIVYICGRTIRFIGALDTYIDSVGDDCGFDNP